MRHVTRFAVVLLFLLSGVAACGEQETPLRWHFQKGQVLKYLFKHREVRTTSVADQTLETTTTTEYEWQWTVTDLDDKGAATMAMKLTALRVACTGKDFDFQYDSARGNNPPDDYQKKLVSFYDQVRFGEYRVQLRPDGRVVKVTGFDKLLGEIGAETNLLDFHALNTHDDTFAWYLQQALGALPEQAAKEGDKWEAAVDATLIGFGQVTGRTHCTLGKTVKVDEQPCREVEIQGSHTVELDMKWIGQQLRGTLKSSKLAGTLRFDPKAGLMRGSAVEAVLAGDLRLGAGDKPTVFKMRFQHTLELEARP